MKPSTQINIRSIAKLGDKNPNWKGGTSHAYYSRIMPKEKCWFCGNKEQLEVHHKNLDKKDNRKENLIVLCKSCHTKLEILLGRKKVQKITGRMKKCIICGKNFWAIPYKEKNGWGITCSRSCDMKLRWQNGSMLFGNRVSQKK